MGQDGLSPIHRQPKVFINVPQSIRLTLTAATGLLFLALIGSTAIGVPPATAPEDSSTTSRGVDADAPNVLVFLTDDMRKDDLSYLPHVRELLIDQGMTFTEAQSPHPLCCPARAELMTGQYAQNNGVHHNTGRYGGWQAFDPSSTIGTWAQDAGYATAIHGKHLNKFDPDAPADPGWHDFDILLEPATDYEDFTFFNGDSFSDDYVTTRLDERTLANIDDWAGKQPFMVFANHVAPHMWVPASSNARSDGDRRGLNPPAESTYKTAFRGLTPKAFKAPSFNERNMRDKEPVVRGRAKLEPQALKTLNRARIRSLLSVDDAVAHAVAALERTGELDDTYIVFTSDNGYALGEHRYTGKDRLSDEILDVPLVVRGPGIPAGTRSDRLVSLVDLTATIVDLMSLTPTLTTDGESFASTLLDPADPGYRDTMLIQTGAKDPSVRFPGWAYRGVLTQRYAYGRRINNGPTDGFLYDHHKDPYELKNLLTAEPYRAVRRELEHRYRELADCTGSDCNRDFGPLPAPGR